MRYDKKSADYQVNIFAFHEMDECVPMTKPERDTVLYLTTSRVEFTLAKKTT